MDLLFKRYANPFLFVEGMIQAGRFNEFVLSFWETVFKEEDEQKTWEYYLHRVFEGSFDSFRESMRNDNEHLNLSATTIETTVQNSMNILKNFNPEAKGGEP